MSKHPISADAKTAREFLALKAREDPELFEQIKARTPLQTDSKISISVSDARLVRGAFTPTAEAHDGGGRTATGQAAADLIVTRQGRHRAAFTPDEPPTRTRAIPEVEFAATDQGAAWYLHTRKHQSYREVAATMGKPVGTIKAMVSKATQRLKMLQTEIGFSLPFVLEELRELWDHDNADDRL